MKIVLVASEVTPFAKTGGLADVAGALPKALKKLGHDVRIIMPFYTCVEKGGFGVRKGRKSVEVLIDGSLRKGLLRWTELGDIPVYLLENPDYFHREGLYGTAGGDYPDNAERFAFFCRGVLQLLKKMDFRPDIIHCNDWQTALIPLLLKKEMNNDPFYARTRTVFTIHNLAFQGVFEKETLGVMGLEDRYFTIDCLEYYGKVNLMKGAIIHADLLTAVSRTYTREICTPEFGCGLEGVLAERSDSLYGIVNGIDEQEWDPEGDGFIFRNYTSSSVAPKAANKKGLQKQLGLPQEDVPLMGIVSRLTSQKGVDLLVEIIPRLKDLKVQLVVFGDGEQKYIEELSRFSGMPNVSITFGFQGELAHRIYAGSDIFLMPSQYEPCGLGQLIALRYGAVPVVRKTGGLADTVIDLDSGSRDSNGFTFDGFDADSFWGAITRALELYENRTEWRRLMRRGMGADYSWERSARAYEELYRKLVPKESMR